MFWAFGCSVGWRMAAFTFNLLNYIFSFSSSAFCYLPFSMHTYAYICIGTVVSWVWLPPLCWQRLWGKQEMEHGVRSAHPWLLNHGAAQPKSASPLNGYVRHMNEAADVCLNSNFRPHVCFISFSSVHWMTRFIPQVCWLTASRWENKLSLLEIALTQRGNLEEITHLGLDPRVVSRLMKMF